MKNSNKQQAIRLDTINEKKIRWIWPGRIPRGKITILAGDPDVGKTFITLDIAARMSLKSTWPDGQENEGGNVLMLSAEDDFNDTILPRLKAAGADCSKIYGLSQIVKFNFHTEQDEIKIPSLIYDLDEIIHEISVCKPKLIIFDPINAYIPGVDSHKDSELRSKVFGPLKKLAEDYDVAIVCIMHLNKGIHPNTKYRISGSIGYVAASRGTWIVVNDQDDEERKLFLPVKFNIGLKPKGLAFKISQDQSGHPIIKWEKDLVDISPDELLNDSAPIKSEREAAEEFIKEILKDGRVSANQIYSEAKDNGISKSTLKRAKSKLKIKPDRINNKWYWRLLDSPENK